MASSALAAIREAHIHSFPIFVNAFITDDVRKQTEQFILVNSTKPLPKGLLYELLPSTDARLPTQLHKRRLPAQLLERLNHDSRSPLHHMVRTPTSPEGVIKDNSMLKMLSNSLSDGALFTYRASDHGAPDVDTMFALLCGFWSAVKATFPDAWGLNTRRSRLMHGAGIVAVGNLMDHFVAKYRRKGAPSPTYFGKHLTLVAPLCAWTQGTWKIKGQPPQVERGAEHPARRRAADRVPTKELRSRREGTVAATSDDETGDRGLAG